MERPPPRINHEHRALGAGTIGGRATPAAPTARRRSAARRILLTAIFIGLLSNSVPIALLPVYQDDLGLRPGALALISAAPTVGILVLLVLGGRLSDALGRRASLLIGLACSTAGMVALLFADGLELLLVGRILAGAGVGAISAAGTAALVDLAEPVDRSRAAIAASAVAVGGLAVGPALGGLIVQHLPAPLRLAPLVEVVLLCGTALALLWVPETVPTTGRPRPRAALRPRLPRTPARLRPVARVAALAVVPAWAVMGLMLAVGPGLLTLELGLSDRSAVAGLVALFLGSSAGAQICLRGWPTRRAALVGLALLPTGLTLLVGAVAIPSVPTFAIAALFAGLGHGLTQLSAQGATGAAAAPHERAAAFGGLLLLTYAAGSASAISVGFTAQARGLAPAIYLFAGVISALALLGWTVTSRAAPASRCR